MKMGGKEIIVYAFVNELKNVAKYAINLKTSEFYLLHTVLFLENNKFSIF